jgi:parvulin-like peptidyl-prolyl isomerase
MYLKLFVAAGVAVFLASAAERTDLNLRVVEEIVAKVNGDIITRGELAKQKEAIRAELQQQGVKEPALTEQTDKRASDALRDHIDQLLLVQKAKELNINVDAEINRQLASMQSQSKISDPDKFHDLVREQTGETFEDFKLQMKNQALTQRVIGEEVYRGITIPRSDQLKYYEDHKADFVRKEMVALREILISTGDNSTVRVAAAEKKAKDLVARARGGEKFGDLARQNSDAPTAQDDGALGTFKPGDLAKPIEDAVFSQAKGYVTDPIRTPGGFEVLRVEEHYKEGQATFEEVENDIVGRLSEPKVQPKLRIFLTDLRTKAFLQIKEGYVDSGAAPNKSTAWQDPVQLRPETVKAADVAAQRHWKKALKVIPYGKTNGKPLPDATPAVTPVPAQPVKTPDTSNK